MSGNLDSCCYRRSSCANQKVWYYKCIHIYTYIYQMWGIIHACICTIYCTKIKHFGRKVYSCTSAFTCTMYCRLGSKLSTSVVKWSRLRIAKPKKVPNSPTYTYTHTYAHTYTHIHIHIYIYTLPMHILRRYGTAPYPTLPYLHLTLFYLYLTGGTEQPEEHTDY